MYLLLFCVLTVFSIDLLCCDTNCADTVAAQSKYTLTETHFKHTQMESNFEVKSLKHHLCPNVELSVSLSHLHAPTHSYTHPSSNTSNHCRQRLGLIGNKDINSWTDTGDCSCPVSSLTVSREINVDMCVSFCIHTQFGTINQIDMTSNTWKSGKLKYTLIVCYKS